MGIQHHIDDGLDDRVGGVLVVARTPRGQARKEISKKKTHKTSGENTQKNEICAVGNNVFLCQGSLMHPSNRCDALRGYLLT